MDSNSNCKKKLFTSKEELMAKYNMLVSLLKSPSESLAEKAPYGLPNQIIFTEIAKSRAKAKEENKDLFYQKAKKRTIALTVISDKPLIGSFLHFLAEDSQSHSFLCFIGNYEEKLNPVLFVKGCQFLVQYANIHLTPDAKLQAVTNIGEDVEVLNSQIPDTDAASAEKYKKLANTEYAEGRYDIAEFYYSTAIEFDMSNSILYSNRANAGLKLEKYESALIDSCQSIELKKDNMKAYYRKALALIGLEEYQEAQAVLEEAKTMQPGEQLQEFQELFALIEKYNQDAIGNYSANFYKDLRSSTKRNFANFISPKIEISWSVERGRGIYAKEDIAPGELILVEKAFFFQLMSQEDLLKGYYAYDVMTRLKNSKLDQMRAHYLLQTNLKDFCDIAIYRPGAFAKYKLWQLTEDYHKFSDNDCDTICDSKSFHYRIDNSDKIYYGIHYVAPYFNHSCMPNVDRFTVNDYDDVQIIQSKREIHAGEEVLINYSQGLQTYTERQNAFNSFNFTCTCSLCVYDLQTNMVFNAKDIESKCIEAISQKKANETLELLNQFIQFLQNLPKEFLLIRGFFTIFSNIQTQFDSAFGTSFKSEMDDIEEHVYDILLTTKDVGYFLYSILKYSIVSKIKHKNKSEYYRQMLDLSQKHCSKFVQKIIEDTMTYTVGLLTKGSANI